MFKRSDEERKQLYLTVVKLEEIQDGYRIILEDDPLIVISNADRKLISDPNGEYAKQDLWRWTAGGVLVIYQQRGRRFLSLGLRDSEAPSFASHLTLTSGLSSAFEEFFNPTFVAIREGIEEIAVVAGNQVVIPSLGPDLEEMVWSIFEKQLVRAKKFGWAKVDDAPVYANTEFVQIEEQKLEIVHGKRVSCHQGIVCIDPKTRGIDFLKIIQINLPQSEIIFFDCEDTKTGPLDREILLFPLEQIKTLKQENSTLKICGATKIFKSGISRAADLDKLYPCTPVLEKTLEAILSK